MEFILVERIDEVLEHALEAAEAQMKSHFWRRARPQTKPEPTDRKIMLIEDDASMQSVLRTLLEIEGFKVTVAPEQKGEDEICNRPEPPAPDVILLDVHLGRSAGSISSRAAAEPTTFRHAGCDELRHGCGRRVHAGRRGHFLLKPYMPDELIRQAAQLSPLRTLMQSAQPSSPSQTVPRAASARTPLARRWKLIREQGWRW
jgi:DNA-binding NtrC family response regulator